jgi:penicillin-binding protein 1A
MLACWTAAAALGFAGASLLQRDLPQVLSLEDYAPPVLTRIYARDGSLLRQFGEQRRIMVRLEDLPLSFRQAIVASEDAEFYRHPGVDLRAILRAAWNDLRAADATAQGASTITQQLARDLFLTKEKTLRRKVQEWVFALQMEKSYTKDEILELYCNQIYFGHGFYGIEAASRFYYGKPASDLTLDESALLAGLVQRPEAYSPIRHPERARQRRNYALRRMVAEKYLTPAQAQSAMERPVIAQPRAGEGAQSGLYFLEDVRKELVRGSGEEALYKEGLEVHTTMDRDVQVLVEETLRRHLRTIDRTRGFRPVAENVLEDHGVEPEDWDDPSWNRIPRKEDAVRGVVLDVSSSQARVRLGPDLEGLLESEGAGWTGEADLTVLLSRGDVTLVRLQADGEPGGVVQVGLDQEPLVEGAVVVLDPRSGEVLALAGGYDFQRSQFNRATQARRQVGSSFKPFLYAAALEKGLAPTDLIYDEPTVFIDPHTGEHSRNIPAVKLINEIGFRPVIDVARRVGVTTPLHPYPSLALGATEVSLMEMVSAYGAFANGGLLLRPHLLREVRGRDGRVTFQAAPEAHEVMEPAVAYVLTQMLQGVIRRGTAASASQFPRPVAGKTGTTDGHSDAWFIGYTPDLVCGVWVGLDQSESIGRGQSGARAALPIWSEIMAAATTGRPVAEFSRPPEVVQVPVDPATGLRASVQTDCAQIHLESFMEGTEPLAACGRVHHFRSSLPYFLQLLPVGEDMRLHLSRPEIELLLERESSFLERDRSGSTLAAVYGGRAWTIGVTGFEEPAFGSFRAWRREPRRAAETPSGPLLGLETPVLPEDLPEPPEDVLPLDARRGLDGRVPSVVVVRPNR